MNNKYINTTNDNVKISFIILTWNSESYITKSVLSYVNCISKENLNAEFFIVDNGSSDSTLTKINNEIKPKIPNNCSLQIIALGKNFGTTISRNIAIRKANGDFIIICDSDTEFKTGQLKETLLFLKRNPNIGILAPHLCYSDGITQNSVRKFPLLSDKFVNLWSNIILKLSRSNNDYDNFPWNSVKPVDTAISAFWIIPKNTFDLVGLLDEKIFYSPEDVDFCLRVWAFNKLIVFYPMLVITHHTQNITRNRPFSKQSLSHLLCLFYLFGKHKYVFSRRKLRKKLNIRKDYNLF